VHFATTDKSPSCKQNDGVEVDARRSLIFIAAAGSIIVDSLARISTIILRAANVSAWPTPY
jgi:hypothetical protein